MPDLQPAYHGFLPIKTILLINFDRIPTFCCAAMADAMYKCVSSYLRVIILWLLLCDCENICQESSGWLTRTASPMLEVQNKFR